MSDENIENKNIRLKQKPFLYFSIILVCLILSFLLFHIYEYNIFNFRHNAFVKGPIMHYFHSEPAVLMNDGNVLIIGGDTKQAEIYDYKKNKFTLTKGQMNYIRSYGATATVLKDGNILITGGGYFNINENGWGKRIFAYDSAEIYNSQKESFSEISKMCVPRTNHASILLDNGNVLLIGGYNLKSLQELTIEEYDFKTKKFKIIANLPNDEFRYETVFKLSNNRYVIIGKSISINKVNFKILIYDYSENKIYDYDKKSNKYEKEIERQIITPIQTDNKKSVILLSKSKDRLFIIPTSSKNKKDYDVINIDNKQAILFGGEDKPRFWGAGPIVKDSEIISIDNFAFRKNKAKLNIKRFRHSSVKLSNGNILVYGGYSPSRKQRNGKIYQTEIYYK